ncbi:MAG: hypothetical protein NVV74_04535 [Magnetospirillum sp.]|nr:hypothetical protein [Magnetospirillum sp.]
MDGRGFDWRIEKKGKDVDQALLDKIAELRSILMTTKEFMEHIKPVCSSSELQRMLGAYFDVHEKLDAVQKPGLVYRRGVISSALSGLAQKDRADTWPLLDIVNLDPEMRDDEKFGFVSDMRRFSVIPVDKVVTDRREWMKFEDSYFRVCRLAAPYKMDFLQKFALLFTRVGLDDRRVVEQKNLFDAVSVRLMPGE